MVNRLLTHQQELFIQYYIEGDPQSVAYEKAGYITTTRNSLDAKASFLIRRPKIAAEIARRKAEIAKKNDWDCTKLIASFKEIYDRSMQKTPVMVFNKQTKEYEQAREEVVHEDGTITSEGVWQYDGNTSCRALENIAKIVGAYQHIDGNTVIINQFLTKIQNDIGMIKTVE